MITGFNSEDWDNADALFVVTFISLCRHPFCLRQNPSLYRYVSDFKPAFCSEIKIYNTFHIEFLPQGIRCRRWGRFEQAHAKDSSNLKVSKAWAERNLFSSFPSLFCFAKSKISRFCVLLTIIK